MRTFLIIILFCTSFLCSSQSPGTSAPVVMPLADSLYFNGQFKEAIPYYEKFLEAGNPVTPLAHYRLAYAYHQNGNVEKAIFSYQTCLSKNPNTNLIRVTNVNLSKAYSMNNRLDSANACLQRAISMGYANLNDLETSPDFNKFRTSPEYVKVHDQLFNAAYPCIKQAEARWFDFWVGEWKAYVSGTQNLAGQSKIEKIAGECAILENWTSTGGGFSGKSINFYNPRTGSWEQHWIGSSGVYQKFEHGEYKDAAMRFTFLRYNANGTESVGKFTFFNLSPDEVRQLSESSNDDGKTWTTDYDFMYKRMKDKMQ